MLARLIDLPHIGFCALPYIHTNMGYLCIYIHTYLLTYITTFPSIMLSLVFHSDLVVTFID